MEHRKACNYWLCEGDIAGNRQSVTFERFIVILNSLMRSKTNYTQFTECKEIVNYEFDQREEVETFYLIVSVETFKKYE